MFFVILQLKVITMTNAEKLLEAFASGLGIDKSTVVDALAYQSIPQWDSLAHMTLIAKLEEAFGISIETEDVLDMSSVAIAKNILEKYDVKF